MTRKLLLRWGLLLGLVVSPVRGEVMLQYFNTSWSELADKMPELAEAGYTALWLPPPTKGSGGLSVGYDLWDPFDLGSIDQRNTVKTRYGTEEDLLRLIETAHRFGLRVYFDNIMNHRAFDVPGYNESTPIDTYPGLVPEDFHLRVTEDGFYRKWDNVSNWNDAWQVQNRNFSDLIDIAHETPNANFGRTEGSTYPKVRFVRTPNRPETYDYHPTLGRVGFYNPNITTNVIAANAEFYKEDVWMYLMRSVRWLVDRTKVDGLRLDAVKHVPSYFFGDQGAGRDTSANGYTGQAQEQFNITRGFSDANHRDSVFNTELGRDDLMMFGEHLGSPPSYSEYTAAGMRLVDATLKNKLNDVLGNPSASLSGLDQTGFSGDPAYNDATGVMFAKSHDDDYASRPELQYAYYLTRRGLPNIYTDGNYQSETLAQSGGAFPRHANTAFLGQFGDSRIPNLVYIHNHFGRDQQWPRWADSDVVAYERADTREGGASDADKVVLFFVMNDNFSSGQYREISTGFNPGAKLWQYSTAGGGFYYTVPADGKIKVITPPGGYFAFSWRTPEESDLWRGAGGRPVTFYQSGNLVTDAVVTVRKDGPDGDPGFNPYGVADPDGSDYSYSYPVPRITSSTNLRFMARVDGSAIDVRFKLDGGIDVNSQMGLGNLSEVVKRDEPPALTTDVFLGYENARFVARQYREKFAARDTGSNNVIGSAGAETYQAVIGTGGFTINTGETGRDSDINTARWAYHDPVVNVSGGTNTGPQFIPAPESAAGSPVALWVKVGYTCDVSRAYLYYTTDGQTYPEGAGGYGLGRTKVVEMFFHHTDTADGLGMPAWWRGELPALTNGTVLRYKIGVYKQQGYGCVTDDFYVPFPSDDYAIGQKKSLMGVWDADNFSARDVVYKPHNDYGGSVTGLVEGFHVLTARAYLQRPGKASLYNSFVQTFYYDTIAPTGRIIFPANDGDTLGSQEYGGVVRTDPTARQVWINIVDPNPANDDGQTGQANGNGTNALGQTAWAPAYSVTPTLAIQSPYPKEWRFTYRNIPAAGSATILARLGEISSSTNLQLSDAEGHFDTLTRLVTCAAPTQSVFVAFPATDGEVVGDDYIMKVWFSKSLADGTDFDTLRSRFLIRINGSAQPVSAYGINYNIDGSHHELTFDLPALYNGDVNFLHNIQVTHLTAGNVTLQAGRYVKAAPVVAGPYVSIVSPPEVDSDGQAYVITLPDKVAPTPEERQYSIRVDTDLSAVGVGIAFANNGGGASLVASTETAVAGQVDVTSGTNRVVARERTLTGTVSVNTNGTVVTGAGTAFATELTEGFRLRIGSEVVVVTQVVSATSVEISPPYPAASVAGVTGAVQPALDVDFQGGTSVRIGTNLLTVSSAPSATNLLLSAPYPGITASGLTAYRIDSNPVVSGNRKHWTFLWTNMVQGFFTFTASVDTNGNPATVEASATRNARVVFRQVVPSDSGDADLDDDDDGLYDLFEVTATNLPSTNPETWDNGEVHVWLVYGKTKAELPDTDGDGLPDGLESGWRGPISASMTDTNADTNGDGWKNFLADLDPPFFNTVPDNNSVPGYNFNDSRTKLIAGSMTDANNPDSDYDGIPDGVEDRNRNGWVDGDGSPLAPSQDKGSRSSWPTKVFNPATWTETDPNNGDSDADGASDGYGEDQNFNGWIDGDANSNRVWEAGELWQETNPLKKDTDGDGLPDGWEIQYGFDALDSGVIGATNLRTGALIASLEHGAQGNPDGDTIVVGTNVVPYVNLLEYQNGTHPRVPNTGAPPPTNGITVGPGPVLGIVNGVTNRQEFTDWTWDDLIALDEYEGDGPNNQGGDVYQAYDGWDTSRDIVAFYARDGGDVAQSGDGNFYFRVDFHDLQAFAEDGQLDLYVVIDTGNPGAGEMALPDDVDLLTSNRWEAVVAVYKGGSGRVYVDTNPSSNSTIVTQGGILSSFGVQARDQATANGFIDAYFNSELDAVEFSISRQALRDAGWNGLNANDLNYQVFSTKDGTCNSCNAGQPGAGDIGGRNDVRDSIYDDEVAEDYWQAQAGIKNVLSYWFNGGNNVGRTKVAMLIHGNQADQPGSVMQNLINNGAGAGYHRPLVIHEIYGQPLNLHVTPTLASAMQWARVDTNASPEWRDGPAFNARIRALAQTNVVALLASTYSDHILAYFTPAFNRDNQSLAAEVLGQRYGAAFTTNTPFWNPERVLDADVMSKVLDLGYRYTFVDQDTHLNAWLGRTASLSDAGYRINRFSGVNTFALNNQAATYRFTNNDGGLNMALRGLFSRKARSGTQDQVVTILSNWEDFGVSANADAYDRNVRWMANHPWIHLVSLEDIAAGRVDLDHDGLGDAWYVQERGGLAGAKVSHNFIQHASRDNYDNWYVGLASAEESLQSKVFAIRPGTNVAAAYGMLYSGGVVSQAWNVVRNLGDTNLARLARSALHASVFQTAFHDEDNNNLERFSIGTYVLPDTTEDALATFAKQAQAQSRVAALYGYVDSWAAFAASVTTPQAQAVDVDLDGEAEYVLYNDRLLGIFERIGGRLTEVFARDLLSGRVVQALGNPVSFSGAETEEEGAYSVMTNGQVVAFRTSGLKDWFGAKGGGTTQYNNDLYSFVNWTNGWRATSSDGEVQKTVTLASKSWQFEVAYNLSGGMANQALYIRNGFSPHLYDLLLNGQNTLSALGWDGQVASLANTNYETTVTGYVGYRDPGHTAGFNPAAFDDNPGSGVNFYTLNMRNQAQTHQVEVVGTNSFTFSLGFRATPSDWDGDGIPNTFEDQFGFLDAGNGGDGAADEDSDGVNNRGEYIANTGLNNPGDYPRLTSQVATNSGFAVRFPTSLQRDYYVWYGSNLLTPSWLLATTNPIPGTGGVYTWTDDGTLTSPPPSAATNRFYRIEVDLPR